MACKGCKSSAAFKKKLIAQRMALSEEVPCVDVYCAIINPFKPGGYFPDSVIEAAFAQLDTCFPGEFELITITEGGGDCSEATGDIFSIDFPGGACIREVHNCTRDGGIIGWYYTKYIAQSATGITPCPACEVAPPPDDCMCCDCGCNCGGEGVMATCDDLVAKLDEQKNATLALSVNVDALREMLLCGIEFFRQAMPNREFWPKAVGALAVANLTGADNVAQQINHQTTILSGTETPSSQVSPVNILDDTDLLPFEACTSTTYCPPGQHRDEETGECVDDAPEGGGGGAGGGGE